MGEDLQQLGVLAAVWMDPPRSLRSQGQGLRLTTHPAENEYSGESNEGGKKHRMQKVVNGESIGICLYRTDGQRDIQRSVVKRKGKQ